MAGLIGGVVIQIALALLLPLFDINLHWLYVGAIAQALTMLLIVIVSLNTEAPSAEQVKPFIWKLSWLRVLDDKDVKRPWWKGVKLWVALYALAWIYVYWRFW